MARKQISKRLRFEVFKRDSFTCQYCGAMPPKVPLEVDHVMPVSKGGGDDKMNLITACFSCNRGKSNVELSNVPESLSCIVERKKLAQQQYKQYQKIVAQERALIDADINAVESIYTASFNGYVFKDNFRNSVKKFVETLGVVAVEDAMSRSCSRVHHEQEVLKYFCGICWGLIKEGRRW
jgi:hypothetical protein